jgi:hypothetical protein
MPNTLKKQLVNDVFWIAGLPFIPDYVIAHAFVVDVMWVHVLAKQHRKDTARCSKHTRKLRKGAFMKLVHSCITTNPLNEKYEPILCSPLIALQIANELSSGVATLLRRYLSGKGYPPNLVLLYDPQFWDELKTSEHFRIRYFIELIENSAESLKYEEAVYSSNYH